MGIFAKFSTREKFRILKARKIYTREILYKQIFQLFSVKNNNKNNSKEINVETVKNSQN